MRSVAHLLLEEGLCVLHFLVLTQQHLLLALATLALLSEVNGNVPRLPLVAQVAQLLARVLVAARRFRRVFRRPEWRRQAVFEWRVLEGLGGDAEVFRWRLRVVALRLVDVSRCAHRLALSYWWSSRAAEKINGRVRGPVISYIQSYTLHSLISNAFPQ